MDMDIECGYCGGKFVLEAKCVKKEIVKENPITQALLDSIIGKTKDEKTIYWLVCPCCNKKIGRFTGYLL